VGVTWKGLFLSPAIISKCVSPHPLKSGRVVCENIFIFGGEGGVQNNGAPKIFRQSPASVCGRCHRVSSMVKKIVTPAACMRTEMFFYCALK
jgi:hypothetical protein